MANAASMIPVRPVLDAGLFELRYSARALRNAPAFAALVALTLAVGVGTNGAVYSALDRFLLGVPEGVRDASLVKRVHQRFKNPYTSEIVVRDRFSIPEFQAVAGAAPGVATAAFLSSLTFVGDGANSREARVDFVLGDFFGVLRTQVSSGRLFHRREIDSATHVAVISHDLWVSHLRRATPIEGQVLRIAGTDFTIVGVAEKGFRGVSLAATHAWVPYGTPGTPFHRPGQQPPTHNSIAALVVRVNDDEQLARLPAPLARALRQYNVAGDTAAVVQLGTISHRMATGNEAERSALTGLAGATGAILLIACVNTAILILVRAARRRRETAIRFALGISRARLLMQIGTETLLFALIAIAAGLLAAAWSGGILRNGLMPDTQWGSSPINGRVTLFVVGFGIAAAVGAASIPAFFSLSTQIAEGMRGSRGSRSAFGRRLRGALLALQAALAVVVLSGAAVFVQSLRNALAIPTGYRAEDVIVVQAPPNPSQPREQGEANARRIAELHEQLRRMPGVEAAALTAIGPGRGMTFAPLFSATGDTLGRQRHPLTTVSPVSAEYMAAIGTRILRGRDFTEGDRAGTEPVVLVSPLAARQFWPREDPLGKCIVVYRPDGPCRTVVGIVDDTRVRSLDSANAGVYVPQTQASGTWATPRAVVLRAAPGKSGEVITAVRQTIALLGGEGSNWRLQKLDQSLTSQLRPHRLNALVFSALAALALIIAAIGIYGTTSYTVSDLTQEIGVRRALGGDGMHVGVLVLRQAVVPVLIGAALGLAASFALGGVSSKLVYQASPANPGVIAVVALTLLVVTVVACVSPFVRALRVSPLSALAAE